MRYLTALFLLLALTPGSWNPIRAIPQDKSTTAVTIVVQVGPGAPVKDELVIVQDLNHRENEIVRALTAVNGKIPALNLAPGLYRVIATAPYGDWQTRIREFLVNDSPVVLVLQVEAMPTHGNGDIVLVGASHGYLKVLDSDGKPAVGAAVLARDKDATLHLERWYKTDQKGGVDVEVVSRPLVVVVVFRKTLVTREFDSVSDGQVIRLPDDELSRRE